MKAEGRGEFQEMMVNVEIKVIGKKFHTKVGNHLHIPERIFLYKVL